MDHPTALTANQLGHSFSCGDAPGDLGRFATDMYLLNGAIAPSFLRSAIS